MSEVQHGFEAANSAKFLPLLLFRRDLNTKETKATIAWSQSGYYEKRLELQVSFLSGL